MNKTKINIKYPAGRIESQRERGFSTECRKAFEYLLNSDFLDDEDVFFKEDKNAIEKMDDFFSYNIPRRVVFTGGAGSGKTAFLRQYFKLDTNNIYRIQNGELYFYHSDEGNGVIEAGSGMQSLIYEMGILCTYIENTRSLFINETNYKEFYDFVVHTKRNVLNNSCLIDADLSAYQYEVNLLEKESGLSFCLMKLKYYLLCRMKDIKKVVLIFDNIKSPDSYDELSKKMFQCMCNYDLDRYDGYQVKVVYAMREDIYNSLLGEDFGEQFDIVIKKQRLMDPSDVFKYRFERAIGHGDVWMGKKCFGEADLRFAYGMLDELNTKFDQKYKKMILKLSQYQKEEIMRCYRKIIFNQTWIQKEVFRYDADSYENNEGFLYTNITCIRALACGNSQVYENTEESMDRLIPNILYNTSEEEFGIHCLLLMKYFLRNGFRENQRHKKCQISEVLQDIFGTECGMFQKALDYLVHEKVITEKKEDLFINSKGEELWDMLQGDSVLLEISREDYYRPINGYNMEPSYKLIDSMKQGVLFEDLLVIIKELMKEENRLYGIIRERGKQAEYKRFFGKKRMTYYLLIGVTKSIEYSSSRSNTRLNDKRNHIEQLVNANFI